MPRFLLVISCGCSPLRKHKTISRQMLNDASLSPPDAKEFEELVQLLEKYEAGQGHGFGPMPEELQVWLLFGCCCCFC